MARTQIDLTRGPIFRKLLLFSLPILLGSIVTEFYNVADSMIVGRFIGAQALAAVSACSPSSNIINMFLVGLQVGASVVVAQKVGARDREHLEDAVNTIASLTLISALLLAVGGLALTRTLLTALNTPEKIYDDAAVYMSVIFIGTAGNLTYNVGSGVLRGMGDSTWSFIFLVMCSLLNLVLDIVAVQVLKAGVAGVAVATAVSQLLSGLGMVARLNRSDYGARLHLRSLRIVRAEALLLAGIALPAAVQNVGNALAALFMQSYVNFFGASFAAANNIVNRVEAFSDIPIMALTSALCTFVGQNIACGRLRRVYRGINGTIALLCGLGVVICALLILCREALPLMFTGNAEVGGYAAVGIFIISFVAIYNGIDRALLNAMRAVGRSVVPMITAQFGCMTRILFGYLLAVRTGDWRGIFLAMALATFARMAAIAVYYYCMGGKRAIERYPEQHGVSVDDALT